MGVYDCIGCGPFNVCSCFKGTSAAYREEGVGDPGLIKGCVPSTPLIPYPVVDEPNMITHPPHYTWLKDKCGVEVWDITQWLPGNLANVTKYVLRAGLKDAAVQDLKKARQYLDHEIERLS